METESGEAENVTYSNVFNSQVLHIGTGRAE